MDETSHHCDCEKKLQAKASVKLTDFLFLRFFVVNLEKFKSQLGQHCENVKK